MLSKKEEKNHLWSTSIVELLLIIKSMSPSIRLLVLYNNGLDYVFNYCVLCHLPLFKEFTVCIDLYRSFCYLKKKKSILSLRLVYIVFVVFLYVFFPFILDIRFVGRTSRGHTGGRPHRISHPPSFCGACLNFSREKDSAVPFPRRP